MYSVFIWDWQMLFHVAALASSFLLVIFLMSRRRGRGSRPKLPPGPRKLPIIGNLHQLGSLSHRSLWLLSQKYGALVHLQLGQAPTLVVSSADMAREILKLHDLDFCSRPQLVCTSKYSYDDKNVAFAPYGDYWRKMRRICNLELFSTARIASFQSIREEEVSLLIESISSSLLVPVNLTEMVNSLTMNIICRVAFSKRNKLGDHKSSEFSRLFEEFQALLGSFFVADFMPFLGWVDKLTGLRARLERNFREFDAFYEEVIEEHIDPKRVRTQKDIVDVLLHLQESSPNLTRAHIKAVLMDILTAGTETSSATITWAMAVGGTKESVKEGDLHRLRYVKSVVKETLRLHSPVPLLLQRESIRTCEVGGYEIEPKTRVYINAWGIGRDPKTWEKPEEFWPEKFMDSSMDVVGQSFELIPIGSGRRVCPGLIMGMITVELALANLRHCFDWILPNGMRTEDLDMMMLRVSLCTRKLHFTL